MFRMLTVSFLFAFALSLGNCASHCKKMQKTNSKLLTGKNDFGKKTKKWKKKQRY